MKVCHCEPFINNDTCLSQVLDAIGAPAILARQQRILLKPNLVNSQPPPITLPVTFMERLICAIRQRSDAEIIIAEGSGDRNLETDVIFRHHGYDQLASRYDIKLIDLNHAPLKKLENPICSIFPTMWLPEIILNSFLVSLPVLKAHSLAGVTIGMKNLIGCAPPQHYQKDQSWKKSAFHTRMHEAIFDLNRYRKPDLTIVDASVGMAEYHLGGPICDPPINKIIAGFDVVAVDAAGARLLGHDWRNIEHIRLAHGILGDATAGEEVADRSN